MGVPKSDSSIYFKNVPDTIETRRSCTAFSRYGLSHQPLHWHEGPTGAVDTPTLTMNTHGTYVFILDSNSEIGAHVLSKIDNFFPFCNFKPWLDTPKLSLGTEEKTNSPSSAYNVTFKRQSTW